MRFPQFSLRKKLILSFLMVIFIGGLLSLSMGSRLVRSTLISQAQAKVKHDLASAWMVFNEKLNTIKQIVTLTAARESLAENIKNNRTEILYRYLKRVREESGLDILTFTDAKGRVIVRTKNPRSSGDDQSQDEIVKRALNRGAFACPEIVSRDELLKEGDDLAARALMDIIPTPKASPRTENRETSGMMLKAGAPIIDEADNLLGALYGAILVNKNYEIVDRIKDLVFKGEKYKGRETGTATIFQQDLRISVPKDWRPNSSRFAIAADVMCDGKYLGQITEAVVDLNV